MCSDQFLGGGPPVTLYLELPQFEALRLQYCLDCSSLRSLPICRNHFAAALEPGFWTDSEVYARETRRLTIETDV